MARNAFYVDRNSLKQELNALSDADLDARLQENWEFLYGEGRMSEDMIQDDAQLEHLTIEARAVERIGAEIKAQRTASASGPAAMQPAPEQREPGL